MLNIISKNLTMSSLDIAELTGKRHDHVLRDITKMLNDLEKDETTFGGIYFDKYKREKPMFNLDRKHTDCLLTGYSTKARMKVIERWYELEAPKPVTQENQLLMLAQGVIKLTAERDEAIKTKAHINDKRTATIMSKLGVAAKKINKLESQLQTAGTYRSLMAERLPQKIDTEFKSDVQTWRVLKQISTKMGLDIKKVDDPRYGSVNAYHIDVIEAFKIEYL